MGKSNSNGASKRHGAVRRDDSRWMRAIEKLGRTIGSLQRELDHAADAALKRRARPSPRSSAPDTPPSPPGRRTGRKGT
jgi:hypothetical protein